MIDLKTQNAEVASRLQQGRDLLITSINQQAPDEKERLSLALQSVNPSFLNQLSLLLSNFELINPNSSSASTTAAGSSATDLSASAVEENLTEVELTNLLKISSENPILQKVIALCVGRIDYNKKLQEFMQSATDKEVMDYVYQAFAITTNTKHLVIQTPEQIRESYITGAKGDQNTYIRSLKMIKNMPHTQSLFDELYQLFTVDYFTDTSNDAMFSNKLLRQSKKNDKKLVKRKLKQDKSSKVINESIFSGECLSLLQGIISEQQRHFSEEIELYKEYIPAVGRNGIFLRPKNKNGFFLRLDKCKNTLEALQKAIFSNKKYHDKLDQKFNMVFTELSKKTQELNDDIKMYLMQISVGQFNSVKNIYFDLFNLFQEINGFKNVLLKEIDLLKAKEKEQAALEKTYDFISEKLTKETLSESLLDVQQDFQDLAASLNVKAKISVNANANPDLISTNQFALVMHSEKNVIDAKIAEEQVTQFKAYQACKLEAYKLKIEKYRLEAEFRLLQEMRISKNNESTLGESNQVTHDDTLPAFVLLKGVNSTNLALINQILNPQTKGNTVSYSALETLIGFGEGKLKGELTDSNGSHKRLTLHNTIGFFDSFDTTIVKPHGAQHQKRLSSLAIKMIRSTLIRAGINIKNLTDFLTISEQYKKNGQDIRQLEIKTFGEIVENLVRARRKVAFLFGLHPSSKDSSIYLNLKGNPGKLGQASSSATVIDRTTLKSIFDFMG